MLWLGSHSQVASYARGDSGPRFASTYRLPISKQALFVIGYTFEGKPHDYLPDVVETLTNGKPFLVEEGRSGLLDTRKDASMSKLIVYLFHRRPRLLLLIGAILLAFGFVAGWADAKQINFLDCSLSDCGNISDSTNLVYVADWDKDLIILGPSDAPEFYIISPSRFSPPLDRATFKTSVPISLIEITYRLTNTDLGFTLQDHNGDSSSIGFIVEQLSWKDASGLAHTSTTDLYRANPRGFQEFSWLAGSPFYTIGLSILLGYVILWLVEAKKKESFPFRSSATAIP